MSETQDCPYCAEEIPTGSERCPACGEWLGEEREETATRRPTTLIVILVVVVAVALLSCLAAILMPMFLFTFAPPAPVAPPGAVPVTRIRVPPPPTPLPAATAAIDPTVPTTTPLNRKGQLDAKNGKGGRLASYAIHSKGGFIMFDLANLRIAVRGTQMAGAAPEHPLSEVLIDPDASYATGGSHSFGPMRFESDTKQGTTRCDLNGIKFDLTGGTLRIGGHRLPVEGPRAVILVDPDGGNPVVKQYTGP